MDIETIGAALRRKLGPLPVWIWAIIGGVIVYWMRSKGYFSGVLGSGSTQTGEALQPSQRNATPPQAQVPLQPGESVYDPNTGALSTAPGGDTGIGESSGTGTDPSQSIDDLANAIAAGFTTHVVVDRTKPKKTKKSAAKHDKKPHKPTKRTATKKPAHHQKPGHKGNTKGQHPAHKQRPRSSATHRAANGGRTVVNAGKRAVSPSKSRTAHATAKQVTRQRPTAPMIRKTAPVQHPVASHTPAPHKTAAARIPASPRPSAPAPRAVRAPAPPPRKPSAPRHRGR